MPLSPGPLGGWAGKGRSGDGQRNPVALRAVEAVRRLIPRPSGQTAGGESQRQSGPSSSPLRQGIASASGPSGRLIG